MYIEKPVMVGPDKPAIPVQVHVDIHVHVHVDVHVVAKILHVNVTLYLVYIEDTQRTTMCIFGRILLLLQCTMYL